MNAHRSRVFHGLLTGLALVLLLCGLVGCQAIFTYTPLASLQRSPASMTPEQRLAYAENALASGDKTAMLAAYNAIATANDTGAAAQYTAAELGIEISGVPQLLLEVVSGQVTLSSSDPSSITSFLAANTDVQPGFLIAAAAKLDSADPSTLQPMDFVYGAMGLALDAAKQSDGSFNFSSLNGAKVTVATNFINDAIATLSPSDPLQSYLSVLETYI